MLNDWFNVHRLIHWSVSVASLANALLYVRLISYALTTGISISPFVSRTNKGVRQTFGIIHREMFTARIEPVVRVLHTC